MVVDPNTHDVTEFRDEGGEDTSHTEDDDHGFVWVSDGPEEDSQRTDDLPWSNEDGPSSHTRSNTNTQPQSREERRSVEWGHTDSISDESDRRHNAQHEHAEETDRERTDDLPWSNEAATSSDPDPDSDSDPHRQRHRQQQSRAQSQSQEKQRQSADLEPTSNSDTGEEPETRNENASDRHVRNDADERSDSDESSESQLQQHSRVATDPIDYDVKELHTVSECGDVDSLPVESETEAHGFVWSDPPEEHRARIEDPTPEQHERLLTLAGIDPEKVGEKPYLTRVSSEAAGGFVVDWMEFLAREAGTEGAIDAIERYQEIGWFTESVEEDLRNNIQWIDQHNGNGFEVFDRGDHLLSFAYVAKIASVNSKGMVFY